MCVEAIYHMSHVKGYVFTFLDNLCKTEENCFGPGINVNILIFE